MPLTADQRQILHDISTTTPITQSDIDWGINSGHVVLAEDGDIDLTQKGREAMAQKVSQER